MQFKDRMSGLQKLRASKFVIFEYFHLISNYLVNCLLIDHSSELRFPLAFLGLCCLENKGKKSKKEKGLVWDEEERSKERERNRASSPILLLQLRLRATSHYKLYTFSLNKIGPTPFCTPRPRLSKGADPKSLWRMFQWKLREIQGFLFFHQILTKMNLIISERQRICGRVALLRFWAAWF